VLAKITKQWKQFPHVVRRKAQNRADFRRTGKLARPLLKGEQTNFPTRNTMFTKSLSSASKLDKAIIASIAAMLAMNVLVMAQQLQSEPVLATSQVAIADQQA